MYATSVVAKEPGEFGFFPVRVGMSNNKFTDVVCVSASHDIAVQNMVTATIGSWSGGTAEVTLSTLPAKKYYVNMPNSGSWSRDYGVLGETVYVTIGGKQYSHWFSNANV